MPLSGAIRYATEPNEETPGMTTIGYYTPFKPLGFHLPSGDLTIATGLRDFLEAWRAPDHSPQPAPGPVDILEALVVAHRCQGPASRAAKPSPCPLRTLADLPCVLQIAGSSRSLDLPKACHPLCHFSGNLFDPAEKKHQNPARICPEPSVPDAGGPCLLQPERRHSQSAAADPRQSPYLHCPGDRSKAVHL